MGSSEPITGFVAVAQKDGVWRTAAGQEVAWYDVHTDLLAEADVEAALTRVLGVYGVSDVVVDAFNQFRAELRAGAASSRPPE